MTWLDTPYTQGGISQKNITGDIDANEGIPSQYSTFRFWPIAAISDAPVNYSRFLRFHCHGGSGSLSRNTHRFRYRALVLVSMSWVHKLAD